MAPADLAAAMDWAGATAPRRAVTVQFRWRYRDERVSYAGRGTARVAPPDSLRFDYRGPFGLGAGAAVVVGDSVVWAEPRANFESLVPAVPLLWVALGTVRPPARDARVYGGPVPDAGGRFNWRFVQGGGRDTLDYVSSAGASRRLEGEWRQGGKVRARGRTEFDHNAMPARARIDFPEASARFELMVTAWDTLAVMPPGLWRSR